MKTFPVLLLFFFSSVQEAFAQIYDDFSDDDLASNPAWSGDTDHFIVNEVQQLQLNTAAAGRSWLSTVASAGPSDVLTWEFYIKQSFAPSGSNFGRFYLTSDQPDLSGSLNGYYLQFGEAGSGDAIELFRQAGSTRTSVCRGTAGGIASAFGVRVMVQYQPGGLWQLYADYSGGSDYVLEATGTDTNEMSAFYCGLLCTYTVSNATRFYFDDIGFHAFPLPDKIPPGVDTIMVISSLELKVAFSEPLDVTSVNPENFLVSLVSPVAATLGSEGRIVTLSFEHPFPNGEQTILHVEKIRDIAGNTMVPTELSFLFFQELPVTFRDIIVSEIFADPTPSMGLPNAEFLELLNRSTTPVDLSGWILSDLTSSVGLPFHILGPKKYVILTRANAAVDFKVYGSVLGLTGFPSLNNAGDAISLRDDHGQVIDSLYYSDTWYRDDEKSEGGWSLELIDPDDICSGKENWVGSDAREGGTPGNANSVYASRPDNTGPRILSVTPIDSVTLLISFSEKLRQVLPSTSEFQLEGGPEVISVRFADFSFERIMLGLSTPLLAGKMYDLALGRVYDCPGNLIEEEHSAASFLLPEKAGTGDLVINEVLFNPRPTGVDFIEVYNQSAKVVDLQNWSLRNAGSAASGTFRISGEHTLIYPGQYIVFTSDAEVLKGEYIMGVKEAFLETNIPPLNDDEGFITLLDMNERVVDSVHYTDEMHSVFVRDNEGISLERISATVDGTGSSNWRSASSVSGYATPGYVNSNARGDAQVEDGSVMITPEVIRQQVAQHDFARISYHFSRGGLVANVKVCDPQGRTVRTIAENELLGTKGFFRWDGDMDNGVPATVGYYMVWLEVFSADGTLKTFRRPVVVF